MEQWNTLLSCAKDVHSIDGMLKMDFLVIPLLIRISPKMLFKNKIYFFLSIIMEYAN